MCLLLRLVLWLMCGVLGSVLLCFDFVVCCYVWCSWCLMCLVGVMCFVRGAFYVRGVACFVLVCVCVDCCVWFGLVAFGLVCCVLS